jgi:hypothetical protein
VIELDGGSLPLGLALVILSALDKDRDAMEARNLNPEEVRMALVAAARRVLDEPYPNAATVEIAPAG